MPETQQQYPLHTAYLSLPPKIKDWLASDQITYLIGEINDRLKLDEEKITVIPTLVLRLAVQDLDPVDFIYELSQGLGIDFPTAKTIAEDIEKKVLRPVETDLRRDVGVDVKLIYFGKPTPTGAAPKAVKPISPASSISPISPAGPTAPPTEWEKLRAKTGMRKADYEPAHAKSELMPAAAPSTIMPSPTEKIPEPAAKPAKEPIKEPVVNLQSFELLNADQRGSKRAAPAGGQEAAPNLPTPSAPAKKEIEEEIPAEPFLLHQENQIAQTAPREQEFSKTQLNLNIKTQDYYQAESKPAAPKAVSIKLETPPNANQRGLETDSRGIRVVHYNGYRTPITNSGAPQKPVNPIGAPLPPKPPELPLTKSAPSPIPKMPTQSSELSAENRVDLRKFAKPDENTVDLRKKP